MAACTFNPERLHADGLDTTVPSHDPSANLGGSWFAQHRRPARYRLAAGKNKVVQRREDRLALHDRRSGTPGFLARCTQDGSRWAWVTVVP